MRAIHSGASHCRVSCWWHRSQRLLTSHITVQVTIDPVNHASPGMSHTSLVSKVVGLRVLSNPTSQYCDTLSEHTTHSTQPYNRVAVKVVRIR